MKYQKSIPLGAYINVDTRHLMIRYKWFSYSDTKHVTAQLVVGDSDVVDVDEGVARIAMFLQRGPKNIFLTFEKHIDRTNTH